MMLQYIKQNYPLGSQEAIYVTMEHPYFATNTLFDFAQLFYQYGGRHLFVDEVHKYDNWSKELKVIYDGFPNMRIVFTASSALDLFRGSADLSRRVALHHMYGLSFREYLNFSLNSNFQPIAVNDLWTNHRLYALETASKVTILPHFKNYLTYGYYPFHLWMQASDYLQRLMQVVNTVIDVDLKYIEGYTAEASKKVKQLLRVISESVPFKPNLTEISKKTGISRDLIYAYLQHLEAAQLIAQLNQTGKGVSTLQKPDKLYLENTNLSNALYQTPEIGNVRETFLHNQLRAIGLQISLPRKGDFYLDDFAITLEVGGKSKSGKQLQGIDNAYIVKDEIETGFDHVIPLWLFGFMY
jgi:hypothetical protein